MNNRCSQIAAMNTSNHIHQKNTKIYLQITPTIPLCISCLLMTLPSPGRSTTSSGPEISYDQKSDLSGMPWSPPPNNYSPTSPLSRIPPLSAPSNSYHIYLFEIGSVSRFVNLPATTIGKRSNSQHKYISRQ